MNLRDKVKKLAKENPELRKHLIPLLQREANMDPDVKKMKNVKDELGISDKDWKKYVDDFIGDLQRKRQKLK